MKKILSLLAICASLTYAKPIVTASILPTKYFVEQIAGDSVSVNVMVEKGADPHTYEPKPKQMKELEKSELYFAIGIEFEDVWLDKFRQNYPKLQIINTQDGVKKIMMDEEDEKHGIHHDHDDAHHHHDGEGGCSHSHGGLDPHIWLEPELVKTQATNIAKALSQKYPQNSKIYADNLAKFSAKLDELDEYIKDKLKDIKKREFVVYHPSWGYFANRYDLVQVSIEMGGKEPKPAQLAKLIENVKKSRIKAIFVAPQFSQKSAKAIAKESGATVTEIDQLPYEWYETMKKSADAIADSLK